MNALKMSISELNLYLNENDLKPFQQIHTLFLELNDTVSKIYFGNLEPDSVKKVNEYSFKQLEVNRSNEKLLKEIGQKVRNMYRVK